MYVFGVIIVLYFIKILSGSRNVCQRLYLLILGHQLQSNFVWVFKQVSHELNITQSRKNNTNVLSTILVKSPWSNFYCSL